MQGDDEFDDETGSAPLLPPDDRLWRHPSELAASRVVAVHRADNRMWAVALLAGAIGALLATGVTVVTGRMHTRTVEVTAIEQELISPVVTLASTGAIGGVAVGASCAQLVARDSTGQRVSSGVVFRSDGMVLTTAHMVTGAQSLSATVPGHARVTAHLVAWDRATDLAVVKIDGSGYQPAPLGTALGLHSGDPIVAGWPTNVRGSVDTLGATMDSANGKLTGLLRFVTNDAVDTLGGPVLDAEGAVVGITSGMGSGGVFATPVDLAREVASELLATGKVTPVWLGVEGHDLPADQSAALGVSGGAVIDKVYSPSPAAAGGLGNGDIVLGVNGRVVGSMAALVLAMRAFPSGSTLTLTVHQGSQVRGLLVTLTPRPTWAS